ncbi:MAG: sensor histidine kinase [Chitinophagaceae bacterium]|nr:sensor histidine kinase [Chitinophagaceae bacterium]
MKQVGTIILFFFVSCTSFRVQSQTKLVDSLLANVYKAKTNQEKLKAVLALCEDFKAIPRDTLDYYAYYARDLAYKTNNKHLRDLSDLAVASDYLRYGWLDSLLAITHPVVKSNSPNNPDERKVYFKGQRLRAMGYATKSRNQEALELFYQIIREAEQWKDTLVLTENMNTIGSIALARNDPHEAMNWLSQANKLIGDNRKYNDVKAAVFVNMADGYSQLKNQDSAIYFINKGIGLFKETENLYNLGIALQRKSDILLKANKIAEAEQSLNELMKVRRSSGDSSVSIDDNLSLIDFYRQTGQIDKAIAFTKTVLATGNIYDTLYGIPGGSLANNFNAQLLYYNELADLYKRKGDLNGYVSTLEHIIQQKDSFDKYNSEKIIAELQTEYEVQKKENTIIQQKLKLSRNNTLFYILISSVLFLFITLIVWFNGHKKREKLEREQSVARAEEKERKRIAADLHDNLGAFAASILSNLDTIQPTPENENAVEQLRNNSREMVSQLNDTIWALKKDAMPLTAVSDRIKSFIHKLQPSYPDIAINVSEKIENDITLSQAHAFHLYRITQEAINNALKHSKGHEVLVSVQSDDKVCKLSIADDGIGMDPENKRGNGLFNMRERAKEAGCKISWLTETDKGTKVEITPLFKEE